MFPGQRIHNVGNLGYQKSLLLHSEFHCSVVLMPSFPISVSYTGEILEQVAISFSRESSSGDLPDPGMEPASLSSSALSSRFFTLSHLGRWCILPNNWMQQDCNAETFLGDIWLLEGNCGSRTIWQLSLSFFELSHPTYFPCSTEGQIRISLSGLPALIPSLLSVMQGSPIIKSLHIIFFLTSVFSEDPL